MHVCIWEFEVDGFCNALLLIPAPTLIHNNNKTLSRIPVAKDVCEHVQVFIGKMKSHTRMNENDCRCMYKGNSIKKTEACVRTHTHMLISVFKRKQYVQYILTYTHPHSVNLFICHIFMIKWLRLLMMILAFGFNFIFLWVCVSVRRFCF